MTTADWRHDVTCHGSVRSTVPRAGGSLAQPSVTVLGFLVVGRGNYGENIVTVAAVMCHALSRKSRDTHFRDHHQAAPEQHLSHQPCPDPGSDVQSIAEESEADLKLRITMTHEEG